MFDIPADIIYRRFYRSGKVLRVARVSDGLCAALYPTNSKNIFQTEAFSEVDQNCPKRTINRSEIGDKVWLRLLDKEPIKKILKDCKEFAGHYVDLPASDDSLDHLDYPTFRIAGDITE